MSSGPRPFGRGGSSGAGGAAPSGGLPSALSPLDFNPTFFTQFALAYNLMPEGIKGFLALLRVLLEYFLSLYSLPIEVFLRRRWGCRALSLFQLCQMAALALLSLYAWQLIGLPLMVFILASAALTVYHYAEALAWEWMEKPWRLSYSWGVALPIWDWLRGGSRKRARPGWLFSEIAVFRFWDAVVGLTAGAAIVLPLLILGPVAAALGAVSPFGLGLFLLVSGGALLLKRHILYLRYLDEVRNQKDAAALAEVLAEIHVGQGKGTRTSFAAQLAMPLRPVAAATSFAVPPAAWGEGEDAEIDASSDPDAGSVHDPNGAAASGEQAGRAEKQIHRLQCTICRHVFRVRGRAGQKTKCPSCGSRLTIPPG